MNSVDYFFFFKQKTAYEMRISDWSSDVCSSDLLPTPVMKNMKMNMPRKPHQLPASRNQITPSTPSIINTNTQKVTRPPPQRSDTQPVAARLDRKSVV